MCPPMRRALAVTVLILSSLLSAGVGPASAATATTTTLSITPPSPAVVGQPVTFTVKVTSATGAIPVGPVTINTAGCSNPPSHTGNLDATGSAVITAAAAGPFSYNYTACYHPAPGSPFAQSGSASQPYSVILNPTTTTLSITPPSPAVVGQPVTFTVKVTSATGAVPVGPVTINTAGCSNPPSHTGNLDATGSAVITAAAAGPFSYNYTACYHPAPGSPFAQSGSASQPYSVILNPTTTSLSITPPSPAVVGQPVTFTVKVTSATGAIPVGSVTINTAGCSNPPSHFGNLDATGTAVITAAASGPFQYNYVACFHPDLGAPFEPSGSASQPYSVVAKASPTISTKASAGGPVGTPVRDVASLAGGTNPTGTVTFRLFSDNACKTQVFTSTNAVASGSATSGWFTPAGEGTYYWTAVYSGDATNNAATSPCNAPDESVVITAFAPPPFTRAINGDFPGPLTVNAGESVFINGARVVGPVTVNPGGSLTVVNAQISRGIVVNAPRFLSLCGTQVSGPAPGQALSVSNAAVPIRVGDPAAGCAGNRFAGQVAFTANQAVAFGANTVSHNATVTDGGPGATVLKANTVFGTLGCTGNNPAPTNAGQVNTAGAKSGQCAGL